MQLIKSLLLAIHAWSCLSDVGAFIPASLSVNSDAGRFAFSMYRHMNMQTSDKQPSEENMVPKSPDLEPEEQYELKIDPNLFGQPSKDDEDEETDHLRRIDNEIALQAFIKIINLRDRGIQQQDIPIFDLAETTGILFEKTLDTIEDASLMFRRKLAESATLQHPPAANVLTEWNSNDPSQAHKPRILVIGSGWASHAFMKCIDTDLYRVLVVSPTNYFVFTPMLASSSVGTTEIRSIVESTRDSNPTVRYLEGKGMDVDTRSKILKVKLGEGDIVDDNDDLEDGDSTSMNEDSSVSNNHGDIIDIPYDVAVYSAGVGPICSSNRTPGLFKKNVYFLKSVNDARRLRSGVIDLLEKASQPNLTDRDRKKLLTFVVVGGGPTGVEYVGELSDFLRDVIGKRVEDAEGGKRRNRKPTTKRVVAPFASLANYTSIILLQGNKDLLPYFDGNLRDSAKKSLENKGVDVRTSTKVKCINGREKIVVIPSVDNDHDTIEEEEIDCGLIVWAAGTMPVKLTEKLITNIDQECLAHGFNTFPSSLASGGRIAVDRWQRVLGTPAGSFLAIGDASCTVRGGDGALPLPQTAQVAAQQGAYVARMLNRGYDLSGSTAAETIETSTQEEVIGKGSRLDYIIDNVEMIGSNDLQFLPPPINHKAMEGDKMTNLKLRGNARAKPFNFLNLGQLAYTGGGEALSQVQIGDKPLFSQAGSIGFLLWRSVYVVKQVSTKTRLLVLFDWFKTRVFGRDVTRM